MKEKIYAFFEDAFGDHQPIKIRFFNMAVFGGFIFSALATLANIISQTGIAGLIVCLICTFGILTVYPLSRAFKNHIEIFIAFILIAMNFIIFPALFFTVGGIESGMPLYFIVGIVFTILLVDKLFIAIGLSFLEVLFFSFIMFMDKIHPEIADRFCVMGDTVYLDTSLDLAVVSFCIAVLVKALAMCFERQQAKTDKLLAQMEELAVKDPLTGAYNRRFLMKYLESGIVNAKENGKSVAIVMFDIDKFKRINDDYGHLIGDEVIKALAATLMKSCRDYDIVSRYGGEEFVLVMPGATEEIAIVRAEAIRMAFSELKISEAIDRPVTISGGVAELKPIIKAPEDFIAVADNNLYTAKETGRNKIVGLTYNRANSAQ